ncbi:hypothetical protein JOE40_000701 [Arthrobacter sp. PvP102]|nr:hypothetical protein [Arthrobacter sp. PvP103]MBP1236192.1 hypothetical protein [Arthrobacter sp. PvP102]
MKPSCNWGTGPVTIALSVAIAAAVTLLSPSRKTPVERHV